MRRTMVAVAVTGVAVGLICAGPVLAVPVQYAGNAHWYEFAGATFSSAADSNWLAAKADAESRTHLGQPGYLATVTDAGENQFVTENFLTNNPDSRSYYTFIGGKQDDNSPHTPGMWNDLDVPAQLGYVIEYTPEPASLMLLGLGGLALMRRRRS